MTLPASAVPAQQRGARVPPIPPPLYYGAAFMAGMLLRGTGLPLRIGARPASTLLGGAVLAAGAAFALAGVAAVVRHRTTIVPHRPVSTLLTAGAFRLSRNPMYAGLSITYLGCVLLSDSWWPLATLPVALALVRTLVIGPEERYLADRFGQTYLNYQASTRRWV
jgi:protein-S-isoprenylcysteine O-methyltransferase Ste14